MSRSRSPTGLGSQIVRQLYKSTSACADHHGPEVIRLLHISTPVDDAIVRATNERQVVFVTGNPGDGKTHVIQRVRDEFARGTTVILDANERDDRELLSEVGQALANRKPLVIAINEGILLSLCDFARTKHPWAEQVVSELLRPYQYSGAPTPSKRRNPIVLDLTFRNNLSPTSVGAALTALTKLVLDDSDAPAHMRYNAARLADPRIAERVLNLLDAVGRTGFHATMRELLGFVAYLITGDIEDTDEASAPYFMNAFVGGQGALFDLIREFDPLRSPHAFLDDILFMCEDKGEDWLVEADWEACRAEDLASFERRKRRAYFEHSLGQRLIRYGGDEIERTFQKLRTSTPPPERLAARILNRFFNSRDDLNTETLTLWVGHQFHARPTRFVAAYQGVPASDLEIAVPVLPSDLSSVFPHHYPDHVVLRHKKMNAHDGLVIDRRLLQMLLAADRVAGLGTRTLEGQRRVGAFYDRLARFADVERSQPVIQILRLDTSTVIRIGVDVPNRQYFVPGI